MKNKIMIILALSFGLLGSMGITFANKNCDEESSVAPQWGITDETKILNTEKDGEIMPDLVENPEYVYPSNKQLDKNKLFDIDKKIDKEGISKDKGEIKLQKTMTLQEFCEMMEKDPSEFTQISPDRLVNIVQVHYPAGLEHYRMGIIENAFSTTFYDAETGSYLGSIVKSLNK